MCGIFGINFSGESSRLTYLGLFALQHRGQESAGIASFSGNGISCYTGMGLVNEVFDESIIERLSGNSAIGHVRYSTAGSSDILNAQPLFFNSPFGQMAVAHNGNITNASRLRKSMAREGAIFQSGSDSEIIAHLVSRFRVGGFERTLKKNLPKLRGAFSFVFMIKDKIIAARDPMGFRPLVYGEKGKSVIFASETCAVEAVGGRVLGEVAPGEIAVARGGKLRFERFAPETRPAKCIFEQVYFARPDSVVNGKSVHSARCEAGKMLAGENRDLDADFVAGVPDSGKEYALGFAQSSGIRLGHAFMRNKYTGRSFIQPNQTMREYTAGLKLAPIKDAIKGKKIILIDDSLVRGTTSRKIISSLRKAGVRSVIMLIASPPVKSPCKWGIDTPSRKELIASGNSLKRIKDYIGADDLRYLSLESLEKACSFGGERNFCISCFSGKNPEDL